MSDEVLQGILSGELSRLPLTLSVHIGSGLIDKGFFGRYELASFPSMQLSSRVRRRLKLRNWLDPTFPERAGGAIPVIRESLAGYEERILLSGPFIDLNPGSAERLVQKATRQRFEEWHEFAHAIGARGIIFLYSYLPIINLSFYDKRGVLVSVSYCERRGDNGFNGEHD